VDVIVHLAAQTGTGQSMYRPADYVQHNVEGTARLLELVSKRGRRVRRIVLASSRAVYGEGRFRDREGNISQGNRRTTDLLAGHWEIYDASGAALESLPASETDPVLPASVYGLTKAWQEQLVSHFGGVTGVEFVILRLQNVYGPNQQLGNPYTGIVGRFASQMKQSGEVELFEDGRMTRDFVYVDDVVDGLVRAVRHPSRVR
jgi:dTDP-L-rhamnose 4-epimerase